MYISNKKKNITLLGKKTNTENHQPFFTFFQFHIRRTQQISHWTMTAALAGINLMKTTRDHEDDDIMATEGDFEVESLFEDIVCYVLYLIFGVI